MTRIAWTLTTAVALAAAGCSGPAAPLTAQPAEGDKPASGGTITIWKEADVIDWDPNFEGRASFGLDNAYNSLLRFKAGPGIRYAEMIVEPELAERWEVSPDAKTYTFHLKKGVKFANIPPVNGREMTSADVKFSAEYYTNTGEFKDKKLPQGRVENMYEDLERVETPDPYTVRYHFKDAFVPFLNYSASDWNPVVPREVFDKDGHFKETMIGTGPFQLDPAASQKGTRYVLKKNPTYFEQGKPYLDEVRLLILLQDATAKAGFQAKQIDVLPELFITDIPDLQKGSPNAQFLRYTQPRAASWRLGQAKGQVTTDLRVRKALNLAMDRDEVNKIFAGGEGQWGLAGAMEGLFTEAETKQIIGKYDPEGAKKLLAEAGYPSGVKMFFPTDNSRTSLEMSLFQLVQAQWKKVGIEVDLQVMERTQQRVYRRSGTFDLDATINLSPLEADNDTILYGEFHSSQGNSTNNAKVADPELDKLLDAQRREPNPEKRRQALRAAVMRIWEMQWQVPMIFPPRWDVVQPNIRNYTQHLSVEGPHVFAWIQK